jgi:hypothetical protein
MKVARRRPGPGKGIGSHLLKRLNANLVKLSSRIEAGNMADFIELTQHPWRLLWNGFMVGLARGVGMFLGAGVMGAVFLAVLSGVIYTLLRVFDMIPVLSQISHVVVQYVRDFLAQIRSSQ